MVTRKSTKTKTLLAASMALSAFAQEKLPLLTVEVLAGAIKQCGAGEFSFTKPADASVPPSFSYLDPRPMAAGKPTLVSTCLAEALKGYRLETMQIRLEPGASVTS